MQNKTTGDKVKDFLYDLVIKLIYLAVVILVIFAVYKIFNWQNIKNKIIGSNETIIGQTYNLPIEKTDKELSYEEEKYLNDILKRFKRQEINVDRIVVEYPDSLLYKEDSNFNIKISFRNSIETTWNNFVSAYLSTQFKKDFQNDINNIEYMDLRFSNKVFYKVRGMETNEQNELLATSTAQSN